MNPVVKDTIFNEMPPRVDHAVVFKTKLLHFKVENTSLKDTKGKRKFKRMLTLLFVDKRKLFVAELSFSLRRSAWPVFKCDESRE